MNKKIKIILIVICILATILILGSFFFYQKEQQEKKKKELEIALLKKINSHYNNNVKTIKKSKLYIKINNRYKEIGTIAGG